MSSEDAKRESPAKPQRETAETSGSVKRPQRGEDDFSGKSDTPRGSEPETRATSGPRS